MKSRFDVRSLICGVLLAVVFTVVAANGKRTSWEYTVNYYNGSHPDIAALTKLGNEGWELVGYFGGSEGKAPGFIFKREQ